MNKKPNILITGGSGYIGSCLALYLKKKYQIINLDKKDNKHLSIEICNLLNLKKLTDILKKKKQKKIIHLAAKQLIKKKKKKNKPTSKKKKNQS